MTFTWLCRVMSGLLYVTSCQREDVAVVGSAVYDRFSAFFFPLFAAVSLRLEHEERFPVYGRGLAFGLTKICLLCG